MDNNKIVSVGSGLTRQTVWVRHATLLQGRKTCAASVNTEHRQGPRINRRLVRTVIRHHKVGWTDSCGQRPARGARILLDVRLVSTSLDSKRAWCFSPNDRK